MMHEPPAAMMLDDPEKVLAKDRALMETYRRDGVEAAMDSSFSENGLDDGAEFGPGPKCPPMRPRPSCALAATSSTGLRTA